MSTMFQKSSNASQVRTGLITTTIFIVVAIVVLTMVVVHEHSLSVYEQEQEAQKLIGENPELGQLRAREAKLLDTVEVLDSLAPVYRIPVERAMELIVDEADK